jgi:hypothetical protein
MQYGLKTDKCEECTTHRCGGEGFGGGRIWRKGALEHRTLGPVTLHQGVRQRKREVWIQKVLRS